MRVTFGRYLPKNSVIHAMDARFKMVMIILLMIAIFLPIGLTGYLICGTVILSIFALSKLNFRMLLGLFPPVLFVFVIIFLMNCFLTHPEASVIEQIIKLGDENGTIIANKTSGGFSGKLMGSYNEWIALGLDGKNYMKIGYFYNWSFLWFSEKAFYNALIMALRIYLMISLTCILTGTTSPIQLTMAIEDILTPLKWVGIPVYIISMIISIALRMIPTLIDEAGRIMKAQASRGIDIKNGKFKDKARGLSSLIIPLLVSAFQKAEDLSYAMEARGYDPYSERTRYIQFKFKFFDLLMLLIALGLLIFMILYAIGIPGISYIDFPWVDSIIRN